MKVYAVDSYTIEQVSEHNTPDDCWMVIDGNVYELSEYLEDHDNKLDIRPWCGKDATKDFGDKAGKGISHSVRADGMLSEYLIGVLEVPAMKTPSSVTLKQPTGETTGKNLSSSSRYNVFIPMSVVVVLYIVTLKFLPRPKHNLLWNSLMLLGLLPSFGLGLFMIATSKYPALYSSSFGDVLYRHVEFSIAFGTACILHFLLRLNMYAVQVKSSLRKGRKQIPNIEN